MAEEGEMRGVSGDAAAALYYECSGALNCLGQLASAVESVNAA